MVENRENGFVWGRAYAEEPLSGGQSFSSKGCVCAVMASDKKQAEERSYSGEPKKARI